MQAPCELSDILVFSHLRWDFVFQRPQHLLSRYAAHRQVYYFEEPIIGQTKTPTLHIKKSDENVNVVVPYLPENLRPQAQQMALIKLVDELLEEEVLSDFTAWYYTPMALNFTRHLRPNAIIYDCMDELSHFKFAPPELVELEKELMDKADLVFTGGHTLFEAKKHLHKNIHPFPSSVDVSHFKKARHVAIEPKDQAQIPHPRIGYFGVIDERMNIELIDQMAKLKPDWQFVMVGPVVKIDESLLPRHANVHYLGKKEYSELPNYISGWDVAMMPFALNDSTKFISPTKTPEYLAGGRPVVSTSITDVVKPYASERLVFIADDAEEFVRCIERAMTIRKDDAEWIVRVDEFLADNSWDMTWRRMAVAEKAIYREKSEKVTKIVRPVATSHYGANVGA